MVGALIAKQVLQRGDRGSIVHYPAFASNFVEPRPIEVWLPEGYNPSSTERYPVIYMHDGQFLFTKSKSWFVWTPWLWKVDVAISDLIRAKKNPPSYRCCAIESAWSQTQKRVHAAETGDGKARLAADSRGHRYTTRKY